MRFQVLCWAPKPSYKYLYLLQMFLGVGISLMSLFVVAQTYSWAHPIQHLTKGRRAEKIKKTDGCLMLHQFKTQYPKNEKHLIRTVQADVR